MELAYGKLPPRIAGDVTIARFSCHDDAQKWRVSVGDSHFLTDRLTARRILALADGDAAEKGYRETYVAYQALEDDPEPLDHFVRWCEQHRTRLEGLAGTADTHALRYRRLLLSADRCARLAAPLGRLFRRWSAALLTGASLALIATHVFRHDAHAPAGNFAVAAVLALCGIFAHELGHVTACVRHGARQGGIGVGLYWIWPAFYADVRGGWALGHVERAVISLGGLYFQAIYVACLCAAELATHAATLATAIGISLLLMFTTLNPVFKYDGYWILSDLLNVTNLHARIGTHLGALVGAGRAARGTLLRARMTVVSVGFVLAATAYIGYLLALMLRMVAREAHRLPGLWSDAARAVVRGVPLLGEAGLDVARFAWTMLVVAFLGAAIGLLGYRTVQNALKVVLR